MPTKVGLTRKVIPARKVISPRKAMRRHPSFTSIAKVSRHVRRLPPPGVKGFLSATPWSTCLSENAESISCTFAVSPSSESEADEISESDEGLHEMTEADLPSIQVIRSPEVYSDSISAQTRKNLEIIVENLRNVDPCLRAVIVRSSTDVDRVYSGANVSLERALDEGTLQDCSVRGRQISLTEDSIKQYGIFAQTNLSPNMIIGSCTGVLWCSSEWTKREKKADDKLISLRSTDVPSELLEQFGYRGPDLVLESTHYGNEMVLIQDCSWGKYGRDDAANCQAQLVIDCKAGEFIPRIIYEITKNVAPGEELLMHWVSPRG